MVTEVTVIRDGAVRATGFRDGDAVVYDRGFPWEGVDREQRSFVLLDTGFQINQPVIFPEQQRGWWYCDLVRVVDEGHTIRVDDHWIDVIVGPPDHPYLVLDLGGTYSTAAGASCTRRTTRAWRTNSARSGWSLNASPCIWTTRWTRYAFRDVRC
ncbi:MAG TPA: hypothetical protein VGB74_10640 [Actinoplanes sp.]